ncbi:unnamed protein product, partial [marine sediment metagenome]
SWLLTPFVVVLSWIASGFSKLAGGAPVPRSLASEEEIRTMITVGHKELLRQRLAESSPIPVLVPEPVLCTDNAAMIAACGYYRFQAGKVDSLDLDVIPSLKLA